MPKTFLDRFSIDFVKSRRKCNLINTDDEKILPKNLFTDFLTIFNVMDVTHLWEMCLLTLSAEQFETPSGVF